MLTLNDGRSELWQWDTGRTINVPADCSQVHFSNKVFGRSIDVDVVDGVANIPDILLQTDKDLTAWAFVGEAENGYTKISKVFKVNKRNKPADYVFTPTDQTTLGEILDRIEDLENRPCMDISKEEIQNAVNSYLEKNPVSIEEEDPTVPEWAKQPKRPTYTAKEVGALPADTEIPPPYELPTATADSLGGVKVIPATDAMTEFVGIDADGKLRVPKAESGGSVDLSNYPTNDEMEEAIEEALANAGGGSGGGEWELIVDFEATEDVALIEITKDINGNEFDLKRAVIYAVIYPPTEDTIGGREIKCITTKNTKASPWNGGFAIGYVLKTTETQGAYLTYIEPTNTSYLLYGTLPQNTGTLWNSMNGLRGVGKFNPNTKVVDNQGYEKAEINTFRIGSMIGSSVPNIMGAGSTIKIMGVRK